MLESFGRRELVEVIDLSDFVAEQRARISSTGVSALITPRERVYKPADPKVAARLRLAEWGGDCAFSLQPTAAAVDDLPGP